MQLDVVELLKQVLQWTPLYKPGLNRALIQAAKVGSVGCIKVGGPYYVPIHMIDTVMINLLPPNLSFKVTEKHS